MNQSREREEDKDENDRGPKRRTRSPSEIWPAIPHQAPDLPEQFKDKIRELQGSEVKLVIQKELNNIDIKLVRNRVSIPGGQMKNDFLTSEERLRLQIKKKTSTTRSKGLQVPLTDPSLHEWTITVTEAELKGSYSKYALGGTWSEVVITNGLKHGNSIQLWSFRVNERPHLVLVKLENEERKEIHSGSSKT